MSHEYRTVDSQHPGYVLPRSAWVAPAFIVVFALASAGTFLVMPELIREYTQVLRHLTGESASTLPTPPSLSFRPFFFLVMVLFGLFIAAPLRHRLLLFVMSAVLAGATAMSVDVLLVEMQPFGWPAPFGLGGNVLNGFAMLFLSAAVILSAHHTPPTVDVRTQRRRSLRYSVTLVLATVVSAFLVVGGILYATAEIDRVRDFALLGGLGPGVILLLPTIQLLLFLLALVQRGVGKLTGRWRGRYDARWDQMAAEGREPPSVAFLVPAHNEAETIADCLFSIDQGSRGYPRKPRIYVVNNASTDHTAEAAEAAFARCDYVTGEVLDCPTPGKSHALNFGLGQLTEEIVIRVDSDSLLAPDVLPRVMRHFDDPRVGGVGGLSLPLPHQARSLLGRIRSIEVYYNVGMVRVAQATIDAVMVLPGQLSAYRRQLISDMGGFAEGINGEDTDLTVRVGRAGWRIVMDPDIVLYSEVPPNLTHLREQRLRWSRSLIHVYKRNVSALWRLQGIRGLWLLPMGLATSVRRASIPLILVYAACAMLIAPSTLFVRSGMALAAVLIGPHTLLAVLALVAYRRFDLIPFLPGYLGLRFFRTYVGLEALLMMRHRSLPSGVAVPEPERVPRAQRAQTRTSRAALVTAALMGATLGSAVTASFFIPAVRSNAEPVDVLVSRAAANTTPEAAETPPSAVDLDGSWRRGLVAPTVAARASATPTPGAPASTATATAPPSLVGASDAAQPLAGPGAGSTESGGEAPAEGTGAEFEPVLVQPGDSLDAIAGRYGTTVGELQMINQIEDPSRIGAGTWLLVPTSAPREE
ncbi:MAG: glycosyltransferase [Dehalococcoidia bacterium]|nr:glycosyltransferase [Dehalococcoidia bacterium]